jgi:hypothetical protein
MYFGRNVLVSYVRLLGPEFNENSQAGKVDSNHLYFRAALDELSRRAEIITESKQVGASVRAALEELRAYWQKAASANIGIQLGYKTKRDGQTIGLLHQPGQGDWLPFTCLNSLRNVEPAVNLILDEGSLGDEVNEAATSEGMLHGTGDAGRIEV